MNEHAKDFANFKTAVRSREYLIQAIFQMLFDNQVASKIIVQFKEEHKSKKVDFELFSNSLLSIEENIKNIESIFSQCLTCYSRCGRTLS